MARSNLNKCLHFASFMVTKQVTCFVVHIQTHDGAPIQAYHQSCPADFLDAASHWALFSCPVVINLYICFVNSLFISSFNKGLVNTKFHINLPNSFYWKLAILLHKYLPLQCGSKSWVNISANSLHNARTFLLYTITPSYIANNNWEASLQCQGSLQLLMVPLSLCYCALFVVSFL